MTAKPRIIWRVGQTLHFREFFAHHHEAESKGASSKLCMTQHLLLPHATVLPILCPNLLLICSCPHCQYPYQHSLHDVSAVAAMLHQYLQLCPCIVSPRLYISRLIQDIRFCFRHIHDISDTGIYLCISKLYSGIYDIETRTEGVGCSC